MRHPKFLALNGNAIALWDEGKDYCDEHLTDGIIPAEAIKTFRFRGGKSVQLLTTSIGMKPDGAPYAPLWEVHPLGYKMHDFLEHNECREAHLANIEQAEESRAVDRERLKRWREAKKAKRETRYETPIETASETPTETPLKRSNQNQNQNQVQNVPPLPPATGFRFDVAFLKLKMVYPPNRITSGPQTEQAFFEAIERAGGDPEAVFGRMLSNLATQKAGAQWQDKAMIPKLVSWLTSGAWEQIHEPAPAADTGRLPAWAQRAKGASV